MKDRLRLLGLLRVVGCAVAAALMLCIEPRAALAYTEIDLTEGVSFTGKISNTATPLPTGSYDSITWDHLTLTNSDLGIDDSKSTSNTTYYDGGIGSQSYEFDLGQRWYQPSSTATYNTYLYFSLLVNFGGRNLKEMTDQLPMVSWPTNVLTTVDQIGAEGSGDVGLRPWSVVWRSGMKYVWFGRNSDESSEQWHTTTNPDEYWNASIVRSIGVTWRSGAQLSFYPATNGNYYYFGMKKPMILGFLNDNDVIGAVQTQTTSINSNIDSEFTSLKTQLTQMLSTLSQNITSQTQQINDKTQQETEKQTTALKDTTGSGQILDGLTNGGAEGFKEKVGLFGQLSQVTDTYKAAFNAGESSTVTFPGITALGVQIVSPATVDLWQNGLSAWREPCRMICTFGFIVCWVNGMRRVFDHQILGEQYDGSDNG